MTPRYPIFIPSKGRYQYVDSGRSTARRLSRDAVPFRLVVEPQEADEYATRVGVERVLVLPFANLGQGSIPARNWIWEHAKAEGAERHWCLDDNIHEFLKLSRGKRVHCDAGAALAYVEDLVDSFTNVALAGLNYRFFVSDWKRTYYRNSWIYSSVLVKTDLPFRWRGPYNEDADLCLQSLAAGFCTVRVAAFVCGKRSTMEMNGGNTENLYAGDGRLKMARSLERRWPGVVSVARRFGRPQHVVDWTLFRTPLALKENRTVPDPDVYV